MSDLLLEVEKYAKLLYGDIKRLSGSSVYQHAKHVMRRLESVGVADEKVLAVALLHDVKILPNYETIINQIGSRFGEEIKTLLSQYTKASSAKIRMNTPGKANVEYFIQVFLNLAENLDVLLIVLSDKTENTKTLHVLEKNERERSANRGLNIYSPLCRFVGLNSFAYEIEDNCFKTLYPREYMEIKKVVRKKEIVTKIYLNELKEILDEYLLENGIPAHTYFRVKAPYSIFKKAVRQSHTHDSSIEYDDLNDIAAFRIIVNTVDQCYSVDDLLRKHWKEEETLRDDYIEKPKPNGYRSLHAYYYFEDDIPFEVQIRTNEMHDFNEYGKASHLFYKMGSTLRKYKVDDPYWLKEINFSEKYHSIEFKQFSDFVYTFTPKGDIIELPKGSTVLDFAYEIHDDVGNHCKAALVNGEIKKLSYELKDGDRVEIKVTNRNNVNMDWLEYAKTSKSKKNIRKSLREKNIFVSENA